MTLHINTQLSVVQSLEFLFRILIAGLCGACIGIERSHRLKEAGLRTHVIVCFAAALMMIVSKYGFTDLTMADGSVFNGTRGADPARIAAQVVSGVSFLGAGVIFKNGSIIRGLTTAAGIWATAGIGLALGAGMYILGITSTIIITILQIVMHRYVFAADSMVSYHLKFTIAYIEEFHRAFMEYCQTNKMQALEIRVTHTDDGLLSYDLILKAPSNITIHDLDNFLQSVARVYTVTCSTLV